jgi:protein-S-isoprenylcysteine O-methyltransferase Ste14
MIGFLIGNTASLLNSLHNITSLYKYNALVMTKANFVSIYLPFVFYIILVLDTLIFSFGYLFESSGLKNVVKSVEPTAFGWFVAIICYPPINSVSGNVIGWYSSDFTDFGNINLNIITGVMSVLLFSIYVWASVALWTKASNLTNRGIICKGPYKYVRHPAYISKNLGWWIMGIPFIIESGPIAIFGLTAWSVIYFLRALTEERHLLQDPDYVEYCKKVKYMFIPGIY